MRTLSLPFFTLAIGASSAFAQDFKEVPPTEVGFKKVVLLDKYVSEGASIGDVNMDGKPDVISGNLWWEGPTFKRSHSYGPVKFFAIQGPGLQGYSNNFFTFPDELTGDKWTDILKVGLPNSPAELAINPGKRPFAPNNSSQSCEVCLAQGNICNESPQYLDVIGDKNKEILAYSKGQITLAEPQANPKQPWKVYNISKGSGRRYGVYEHGLGAGDINADGLQDILEKNGWWEQPKNWDKQSGWKFHPFAFAPQQGGAQMFAYDVDGDGDNDVVTALNAHKYGMSWYEQIKINGDITFIEHKVMTEKTTGNPYGVCFSQPHAMDCVDIDGDGVKDIITGKCFFAHNGKDPGAHDPAVLYWFKTHRKKDGSAELIPYLIDDNSGVGRQISTGDLNGDGKMDIVVGNKKGVFAFIQEKADPNKKPKRKSTKTFHASQFTLTGNQIKYGGNGFIGWWYDKNSYATLPLTVTATDAKAIAGKAPSKKLHVSATFGAANHAGGTVKLVLSKYKDATKPAIKTWSHVVKPTGNWETWRTDALGIVSFPKAGQYYLHFLLEKQGREFINLQSAKVQLPKNPAYDVSTEKGQARKSGGGIRGGNDLSVEAQPAEKQAKSFNLPEGFIIELVSSEEYGAVKPISISFDDKGRLWTQTAREYPADKDVGQFQRPGRDKIIYFEKPWERKIQTPKVYAEGLSMPNSVLEWNGDIYAVHGPDILLFKDLDGDGKADTRKALVSGFGIQDTHTNIHNLTRTAGGWITFSQGCNCFGNLTLANGKQMPFNRTRIARMNPQGTVIETLAVGMNNIWCWPVSREGRTFIHEANDFGYSQVPYVQDSSYPSFVKGKRYPDSELYPPTANGLNLGGTGFSGIVISEDSDRGFPAKWRNVNFVANPITGAVNTVSYEKSPNGEWKFTKLPDLVTSSDSMFRPVQIEFGPDGCLYIVDWYNRIISHNEVPVNHPARDKVSGRIWRVRHESQKPYKPIDMTKVATADLVKHLKSTNHWECKAAWHQIVDRNAQELIPAIVSMIQSASVDGDKVLGLWTLEGLGYFDKSLWAKLLKDSNENVRYEAIRSMGTLQPDFNVAYELLKNQNEKSYYPMFEIARFFRDTPNKLESKHIALLDSLKFDPAKIPTNTIKGWKGNYKALGGNYEQNFMNFLVEKAKKQDRGQTGFNEAAWNKIIANLPEKNKAEQKMIEEKAHHLTEFFNKNGGDVANGKTLFEQRCSICHDAAKGASAFAPALNGGKKRDAEGIVMSVLDPAAAVETVFLPYRVIKKDGSTVEAFRSAIDKDKITLMYMGGGTVEIPMKDIKKAGYVKNGSVMPPMGAGLSDKEFADLIEYIQTIK